MKNIDYTVDSFMDRPPIQLPDKWDYVDTSERNFGRVLDSLLNTKQNLLINGRAGCGKSLLIKMFCSIQKNVIVVSTTGLTALNLCTEDVVAYTPHSFFLLPPQEILPKDHLYMTSQHKSDVIKLCPTLIIDEISMMSNHMFDFIMDKLKYIKGSMPRIILFGDLMQLPPVVNLNNKVVKDFYDSNYNGNVMFFNSKWYKKLNFKVHHLRKSYRQKDLEFESNLYKVGYNDYEGQTLDYFNKRKMQLIDYEKLHKNYIHLCPTNQLVNKINMRYIDTFPGKATEFKAKIIGNFSNGQKPTDEIIKIKKGIQVMCTRNRYLTPDETKKGNYRNGSIGTVIDIEKDSVIIELEDGRQTPVGIGITNKTEAEIDSAGNVSYKIVGTFSQLDCKPVKAMTIHKSQGKTIENIYLSLNGFLPPGLIYVALSRLKDISGLGMSHNLIDHMIKPNMESMDFLEKGGIDD